VNTEEFSGHPRFRIIRLLGTGGLGTVWEAEDIERGLKESRLGINPNVDGKLIRLPIPELSEERRKELVKVVKRMGEEARVRVDVVDISGRRVRSSDLGRRAAGEVVLRLEARDDTGQPLPSGVYFLQVRAGRVQTARKWVVVR
jgi:serine/threonine protein kinase